MREAVATRPAVSVAELQRAWHAVKSGQFRRAVQGDSLTAQLSGTDRAVVDPRPQ